MPFPLFGREHFLVGIHRQETFALNHAGGAIGFGSDLNASLPSLISKLRSSALTCVDSKRIAIRYVLEIRYS